MRPEPLVTPEAVPLELATAGVGSRFVALALDWLVQAAITVALVLGFAASELMGMPAGRAAFTVLILAVVLGYPVGFETLWRGRTPGKAAMGLRVVTVEGAPVGFRHAALRAVLGLVDFLLTFGAAAVISSFVTVRNQRLGDLVAGTVVLHERGGARMPAPATFSVPPALTGFAEGLDTTSLTPDDYAAVRAFLLRSSTLVPAASVELARQLANALVVRTRPSPPEGCTPWEYLVAVAVAYQRRHRVPAAAPPSASPAAPAARPGAPDPGAPDPGDGDADRPPGTGFAPMG